MQDKIKIYLDEILAFVPGDSVALEDFRIRFLGRKGVMGDLFEEMKTLASDQKKDIGRHMNELKNAAEEKLQHYKALFESKEENQSSSSDLSRPGEGISLGSRHPLSIVRNQIIRIFSSIGFVISEGPEIEDDWHNFGALNFPPDHPARDMQDTFFIEKGEKEIALRTHTSSVQVRVMENSKPPIRTISPGRVYRNEAISARAHCIFHQDRKSVV